MFLFCFSVTFWLTCTVFGGFKKDRNLKWRIQDPRILKSSGTRNSPAKWRRQVMLQTFADIFKLKVLFTLEVSLTGLILLELWPNQLAWPITTEANNSQPIRTRINCMKSASSNGTSKARLVLVLFLVGWKKAKAKFNLILASLLVAFIKHVCSKRNYCYYVLSRKNIKQLLTKHVAIVHLN